MKNLKIHLITLLTLLSTLLAGIGSVYSQDTSEKKEAEEQEMRQNKAAILSLAIDQEFVITATRLMDRQLNMYNVKPSTNFIKIDGKDIVIQFGLEDVGGWNGVGGLTVEGTVRDLEITGKDGLKPTNINASVTAPGYGHMSLFMTVFNDGAARATITGSFGSRLNFYGEFKTLDGASIYKGMSQI